MEGEMTEIAISSGEPNVLDEELFFGDKEEEAQQLEVEAARSFGEWFPFGADADKEDILNATETFEEFGCVVRDMLRDIYMGVVNDREGELSLQVGGYHWDELGNAVSLIKP
jgi:hypothetical protein